MRAFCLMFLIVLPAAAEDGEIERLRREVLQLRERAVEAEALAEVTGKALDGLRARYVALEERNGELKEENEMLRFWLRKYRKRYADIGSNGPTGKVVAVEKGLIVLSCGSKDGVRVGDTFQLRRGSTYVGQAVVTKVDPEQSVAEFDNEFRGKGAPPKPGDTAESGLY